MSLHPYLIHFAHPRAMYLLALLPVLSVFSILAGSRRRRALALLGNRPALEALATVSRFRRGLKSLCLSASLFLVILAIAGPQWGYEPKPKTAVGRDLVIVLDLSRSMAAEDVLPSRLGRARQALLELVDVVQKSGGHRLGLIAFAGQARVVCPLTPDYDHFREALADLDPADPLLVPKPAEEGVTSGTRMGLALTQAVAIHDARFRGHQDVLMISDGDDPARDDEWAAGADLARERGIPVFTVGIGNPDEASPIPDAAGGPLLHDGKEVRTRLEERPLEEIARVTGGVYIPARLDMPPVEEWFRTYVRARPGRAGAEDVLPILTPRYAWFLGGGLALFALTIVVGDRPRARKRTIAPFSRNPAGVRGQHPANER